MLAGPTPHSPQKKKGCFTEPAEELPRISSTSAQFLEKHMAPAPSSKTHPPLVVRYHGRMKQNKVYVAQVVWKTPPSKPKGTDPYTIRFISGGAQVVPSERTLDPTKPKEKAVFYITPIAKGPLRGERVEVLQNGQKVQEIALRSRVTNLKWFWIFLLLTFLVPWYLYNFVQGTPEPRKGYGGQWESVIDTIDKNTPPRYEPVFTEEIKNNDTLQEVSNSLKNVYVVSYAAFTQDEIDAQDRPGTYRLYLPFWIGVGFFVLAIISWIFSRQKRRKKTGQPVPIVSG